MFEQLMEWDKAILLLINGHHNTFWDAVMWFVSGVISWLPLYVFLIVYLAFKYKKQSWLLLLLIVPLLVLSDQTASGILKPLVHRLRPSHQPGLQDMLHYVNGYRGGSYGFISSHACNFFALASYLSFAVGKRVYWLSYLMFSVAVLVSYSRIYLGVHYPSDVLVAAILGSFFGWAISKIFHHYNHSFYNSKT